MTTISTLYWSSHEPIWTNEEVERYRSLLMSDDWEMNDLGLTILGYTPNSWDENTYHYPSNGKVGEALAALKNNFRPTFTTCCTTSSLILAC